MTTKGRHRCRCRRVLLEPGDAPVRELVAGFRVLVHRREVCGPPIAEVPAPEPQPAAAPG